eukprot:CAMPEP_0119479786 /NCGR_PEP_ID=MMETSP1344-20130328/8892_1 /TAXON_ID=236787 /ORGANISM="Florenciella parvula, Strain CCMP2471" /LENGTH=293 /DNA_ID=CAMNT_0007514047 /DNA_START=285 /DNA_END=1163 /DNA_ORIENTATION=+
MAASATVGVIGAQVVFFNKTYKPLPSPDNPMDGIERASPTKAIDAIRARLEPLQHLPSQLSDKMARLEERREQLARKVEASLADEREAVAHDKRQLREKAEVFRVKLRDIESTLEREREAVAHDQRVWREKVVSWRTKLAGWWPAMRKAQREQAAERAKAAERARQRGGAGLDGGAADGLEVRAAEDTGAGRKRTRRVFFLGDSLIAGVGCETGEAHLPQLVARVLAEKLDTDVSWKAFGHVGGDVKTITTKLVPKLHEFLRAQAAERQAAACEGAPPAACGDVAVEAGAEGG